MKKKQHSFDGFVQFNHDKLATLCKSRLMYDRNTKPLGNERNSYGVNVVASENVHIIISLLALRALLPGRTQPLQLLLFGYTYG